MSTQERATESVWDYPRPPRVEIDHRLVVVEVNGVQIASTDRSARVLETSHPPVFYVPPDSVKMRWLSPSSHRTACEFKGTAHYWDLLSPVAVPLVAWSYPSPSSGYESLRDWIAFYPSKVDCSVEGRRVEPQAGGFYGGWITAEVRGPFKGGPGTWGW